MALIAGLYKEFIWSSSVAHEANADRAGGADPYRGPSARRGGAIILPGVSIDDGSLIGAGSVVTRDVPAEATAFGNPARPCRNLRAKSDVKEAVRQIGETPQPAPRQKPLHITSTVPYRGGVFAMVWAKIRATACRR
jgi:hypothetical protein